MKRVFSLSLLLGFLGCQMASVGTAQERLRIVQDVVHKNPPVVVVTRRIGDKPFDQTVENRHGMMAGPNWIEQLAFDVKNVSKKNIAYIHIELIIPKTGKMANNGLITYIIFGNRAATAETINNDSTQLLKPDDQVKLKVSNSELLHLQKFLTENEAQDVERVTMDIRSVHFDDGTGWNMGIEMRQDPSDPKIWRPSLDDMPIKPLLSSKWIAMLVPPLNIFSESVALPFRRCRNFFVSVNLTPPPSECGYFRGNENWNNSCSGCTAPDDVIGCDRLADDPIFESAPESYGFLDSAYSDRCRGAPNFPGGPPTCNSCPNVTRAKWFADAQCGQPHGCGGTAQWGVPPASRTLMEFVRGAFNTNRLVNTATIR